MLILSDDSNKNLNLYLLKYLPNYFIGKSNKDNIKPFPFSSHIGFNGINLF